MEDITLVTLVVRGRKEAYRALVDRYQSMVYNIAYKILLDEDEAKDAAQEAFIKAYNALPSFKGQSKFSTWLYRIAWTTTVSKTRKKKRNVALEEAAHLPEDEHEGELEANEKSFYLHKALGYLPEQDRLLLSLYYLEEMPLKEVAEIAGLELSNTKVKIHRARKKLAIQLAELLPEETEILL